MIRKRQVGDHAIIGGSVWVLVINQPADTDISVYHTEQGARDALLEFVDAGWPEAVLRPFDDAERVSRYFRLSEGKETYVIQRTVLLP